MPSLNPPQYGFAYETSVCLVSQSDTKLFQVNPTLATGDVKVQKDNGSASNITTLPTVIGSGRLVKIVLSATEMQADNVAVTFSDASGAEWCDVMINIPTWRTLLHQGTAQGGGGGYIDLDTGASSSNDFYNGALVHIYAGTGSGQSRIVDDYTGSSRRVTTNANWVTNPDSTSLFKVYPASALSTTAPTASEIRTEILTTAMTEAYASDGAAPTPAQALFAIQQMMQEKSLSSTTMTVKKLDGSTTAMTFTLNDATTPTSITRAT